MLTIHLHLVPKVINDRAIPPLPHISSWCDACLVMPRDNFTFYLTLNLFQFIHFFIILISVSLFKMILVCRMF
jgi:hypothetical protein